MSRASKRGPTPRELQNKTHSVAEILGVNIEDGPDANAISIIIDSSTRLDDDPLALLEASFSTSSVNMQGRQVIRTIGTLRRHYKMLHKTMGIDDVGSPIFKLPYEELTKIEQQLKILTATAVRSAYRTDGEYIRGIVRAALRLDELYSRKLTPTKIAELAATLAYGAPRPRDKCERGAQIKNILNYVRENSVHSQARGTHKPKKNKSV